MLNKLIIRISLGLIITLVAPLVLAQQKKAGQESCDGALDVVPAKAMTFFRKRRPDKPASLGTSTPHQLRNPLRLRVKKPTDEKRK